MSELLPRPCPFCGHEEPMLAYIGQPAVAWQVGCLLCGADGPRTEGMADAVTAWNKRPVQASEARGDVEAEARRLFELNSAGWSSVTPWDQLHAETRELWLDKARRRLSAHTQAGPVDGKEGA
ncbi:MAG TPA: Lar family restriction alleviation protein [Lysobacter sp.]